MGRIALILGILGQDGAILAKRLIEQDYTVYGGARTVDSYSAWRLNHLTIFDRVNLRYFDINDRSSLQTILREARPSEVYFLAANSKTYSTFHSPTSAIFEAINGVANLCESVIDLCPQTRIFFAGSSEMYGNPPDPETSQVTETSPCTPVNPYGLSKLALFHLANQYRSFHGLHIVNGILFNHESALRAKHFVTRKITFNLARLKLIGGPPITLGNIEMQRDWSSAYDVVDGIHKAMQRNEPGNYLFGSGRLTSVRDFFKYAATAAGFSAVFRGAGLQETCTCSKTGRLLLTINPKHFRNIDTPGIRADSTTAKGSLNWMPRISVEQIAYEMISADLERWARSEITH